MTIRLNLTRSLSRAAFFACWLLVFLGLAGVAARRFVIAVVSDPRVAVEGDVLAAAAQYFPESARLQTRMAARLIETGVDATQSHEDATMRALLHATRAVELSPQSYEPWLLRAAAKDMQGDLAGAETDLRQAVTLAPARAEVRWRLANLLVRADKLPAALPEFRAVIAAEPLRLEEVLNLVWEASGADVAVVKALVHSGIRDAAKEKLSLALFLAKNGKSEGLAQAVEIFQGLDRRFLLASPDGGAFLDALIASGETQTAQRLWRGLWEPQSASSDTLLWNGGFESKPRQGFTQFDWQLAATRYARIEIVAGQARTGQGALQLAYQGVHTTRLEKEVGQTVVVTPGRRYQCECFVKADKLETPNTGLQLAIIAQFKPTTGTKAETTQNPLLAVTEPLASGSFNWRSWTTEFVVPTGVQAVSVSLKQVPEFSFTEPTRGMVWLDDCSLRIR